MKSFAWIIATSLGLALPAFAQASPAWLADDAGLMAGPDRQYPLLDHLQAGTEVDIQGCTEDLAWCDVIAWNERGWVPADALQFDDGGQWLPVVEYAPAYAIPIVQFSIRAYWGSYYRYQPFYGYRRDWYRWTPPPRVVPLPHPIFSGNPPPRVVPLPHPIFNGNPPPRVVPLPHPIFNGNPPPRVVPLPHPIFNGNPPPRVVPLPHPTPNPPLQHATAPPRATSPAVAVRHHPPLR